MIKIFWGEDRVAAKRAITDFLGQDYEIIEGADLTLGDLPSVLKGQSLFNDVRRILIRDISNNKAVFEKLPEYLNTPHKVAIFETKLDKRAGVYKALKDKVEIKEFALKKNPDMAQVFNIYSTAWRDGRRAVEMLTKIENQEEPMMFFGLLVYQAIRDYSQKPGAKEKKALKELSHVDLELKSSKLPAWLIIKAFLLRLSSL